MSNNFYSLTPDAVINAVEKNGFRTTGHYMILNSYENRVYDLKLEDESHIITKFYRPNRWSQKQIQEEHSFLLDLKENEIPVCTPLTFPGGGTIRQAQGIYFSIWPRTGGRTTDELSDSNLANLGRLLARIHNNGASKESNHRFRLTGETYGLKPLEFLTEKNFLPQHCIKRYSNAVNEVVTIYDDLTKNVPFHRIHGDCHLGNLLKGNDGWFFLDFDDFITGPAIQDIWMLVPGRDREGLRQRDIFIQGYREFRDFDNSWIKLIEPLRALRYVHYASWIARRWDDPAFPAIFPHFGTEEYWEEETSDLEDQLNYIYKNSEELSSSKKIFKDEEKELTNEDFFWDMKE